MRLNENLGGWRWEEEEKSRKGETAFLGGRKQKNFKSENHFVSSLPVNEKEKKAPF